MTEREKIIKIIEKWAERTITTRVWGAGVYDPYNAAELASALIAAGIGDVSELKKHRVVVEKSLIPEGDNAYVLPNIPPTVKQLYSGEEVEKIVKERDEYKHRAQVAERALVITAERVLEYAEKANMTAMTSDGFFSCDKDAQLALLANDALLKAEQKMTEEEKEGRR